MENLGLAVKKEKNVENMLRFCMVLGAVFGTQAFAEGGHCEDINGASSLCDAGAEKLGFSNSAFPGSSVLIGNDNGIVSGGAPQGGEAPGDPPGSGGQCPNILVCGPGDGTSGTGVRLLDLESDLVDGTYAVSFTVDASDQQTRGDVQHVPFFATEFVAATSQGGGKGSAEAGGTPSPAGGWITLASERDHMGQMWLATTLDITRSGYGMSVVRSYAMNGPVEVDVSVRWVNGKVAHYFVALDDQLIVSYGFHSYFSALPCLEGCTDVPLGNEHRPASINYGNLGASPFVDPSGGWHGLVELGGLVWEYTVGSGGVGEQK